MVVCCATPPVAPWNVHVACRVTHLTFLLTPITPTPPVAMQTYTGGKHKGMGGPPREDHPWEVLINREMRR